MKAPDPRFTPFRQTLQQMFADWYKWECPWDGMEANQLSRLLKSMPKLTKEQFSRAVKNVLISGDIPKGQRPGKWLHDLSSYIEEAHNTFGRNPSETEYDLTAKERAQMNHLRASQGMLWRPN